MIWLQAGMVVAFAAAAMDPNTGRRIAVIAALMLAFMWSMHTQRVSMQGSVDRRNDRVFAGLPNDFDITDAQLADVKSTPKDGKYSHVEANDRVMTMFDRLRALRKFNEHTFAMALTYADYLLENGGRGSKFTTPELTMLKDKVMNTLAEFAFVVPARFQRDMRLADKLRAMDTVLFMEAIAPIARVVDVYPTPNDPAHPGLYSGH
jgi:hypothetical protein